MDYKLKAEKYKKKYIDLKYGGNYNRLNHLPSPSPINKIINDYEPFPEFNSIKQLKEYILKSQISSNMIMNLKFSSSFNENISALGNLINLTHLTFGNKFNEDIRVLENLRNLTH